MLAPKPGEIVMAPFLGSVGGVRGSAVLLEGKFLIFEVLFHLMQSRGQIVIDVGICVHFGALFHKNQRGFPSFYASAQTMADAGFWWR